MHAASFKSNISIDIFVLTSYREGLPRVLIEASASKLPLIGYDVPGVREVILNDVNGKLVPFGSVGLLEACVKEYIKNPHIRIKHGNNSYDNFKINFSIEAYKAKISSLYKDVIS